eukprot:scaffold3027_cov31-Tisochrysis_lutea.AAC.3
MFCPIDVGCPFERTAELSGRDRRDGDAPNMPTQVDLGGADMASPIWSNCPSPRSARELSAACLFVGPEDSSFAMTWSAATPATDTPSSPRPKYPPFMCTYLPGVRGCKTASLRR